MRQIICSKCKVERKETLFHKDKHKLSGRRPDCKYCQAEYHAKNKKTRNQQCNKNWHTKYKYTYKEINKKRYLNNKLKARDFRLKNMYGIGIEEFEVMFNNQKGCCKICSRHQSELDQTIFVDHCHVTKKVRGLLCRSCNFLLGAARDKVSILNSAINYLNESKQECKEGVF